MHPCFTRPLDRLAIRLPFLGVPRRTRAPIRHRLDEVAWPASPPFRPEIVFGPPPPALDPEAIRTLKTCPRTRHIAWPSPSPSGIPVNDQVRATLYTGGNGSRPLVVLVPAWRALHERPFHSRVRSLLRAGLDVLFYHPPYHLSRTPKGMRPGTPFLSWDLPGVLASYRQAIAELRQITAGAGALGFEKVGLLGLSLGGQLCALLATLTDRPATVALAGPPVDLTAVLLETPLGSIYRALLEESGELLPSWLSDIERLSLALNPSTYEPAVPPGRVILAIGENDLIVPPSNSLALSDKWRIPARRFRHGHMTLVFWEKAYIHELARRIRLSP